MQLFSRNIETDDNLWVSDHRVNNDTDNIEAQSGSHNEKVVDSCSVSGIFPIMPHCY